MWHKPCRTFHPWCPCIKTRCLFIYFRLMNHYHIEARTKWPILFTRHSQMYLTEQKVLYSFYSNFTGICFTGSKWLIVNFGSGRRLVPSRRKFISWTNDSVDWCIVIQIDVNVLINYCEQFMLQLQWLSAGRIHKRLDHANYVILNLY